MVSDFCFKNETYSNVNYKSKLLRINCFFLYVILSFILLSYMYTVNKSMMQPTSFQPLPAAAASMNKQLEISNSTSQSSAVPQMMPSSSRCVECSQEFSSVTSLKVCLCDFNYKTSNFYS